MSPIKEVNVLEDFNLTLDHFYSIIKPQVGNLAVNQYVQLQATALPIDISPDYPWFSLGVLMFYFDTSIHPKPVSDNLSLNLQVKLSQEFGLFLSDGLALIELKELDSDTRKKIQELQVDIDNIGRELKKLLEDFRAKWEHYCSVTLTPLGDKTQFEHWSDGQYETVKIKDLTEKQNILYGLETALRNRAYADPEHQAFALAFANYRSGASRMRFPRYEDNMYEDVAKFSPTFFAGLSDNDSALFRNLYLMTPNQTVGNIANTTVGQTSSTLSKTSQSSSSITTDWNASGSAGKGFFKVKVAVSSHTAIKEDFTHVQNVSVGVRSLQGISFDPRPWFLPSLFSTKFVLSNEKVFERYLGAAGTLLYYPSHLVVARGLKFTFHSSQDWQYDYESSFSASGSGGFSAFGVNFGFGGGYSKHEKKQLIERRGHDLVLDDGETNIRVLGYTVLKNTGIEQLRDEALKERFVL